MGGAVISFRDVHGIADELGVDVQTVRRWIQSGKLRAFKPGKEYRVREADLEEFLAAREVRPKGPTPSPDSEDDWRPSLRSWIDFTGWTADRWEAEFEEREVEWQGAEPH